MSMSSVNTLARFDTRKTAGLPHKGRQLPKLMTNKFLSDAFAKANQIGDVVPKGDQDMLRRIYDELVKEQVDVNEIHEGMHQYINAMRYAYEYAEEAQKLLRGAQELVSKASGKSMEKVINETESFKSNPSRASGSECDSSLDSGDEGDSDSVEIVMEDVVP